MFHTAGKSDVEALSKEELGERQTGSYQQITKAKKMTKINEWMNKQLNKITEIQHQASLFRFTSAQKATVRCSNKLFQQCVCVC